jgi:hypothetical protein
MPNAVCKGCAEIKSIHKDCKNVMCIKCCKKCDFPCKKHPKKHTIEELEKVVSGNNQTENNKNKNNTNETTYERAKEIGRNVVGTTIKTRNKILNKVAINIKEDLEKIYIKEFEIKKELDINLYSSLTRKLIKNPILLFNCSHVIDNEDLEFYKQQNQFFKCPTCKSGVIAYGNFILLKNEIDKINTDEIDIYKSNFIIKYDFINGHKIEFKKVELKKVEIYDLE